jgi:Holliday junction DNA helicase RuvA
MIGSLTGRLLEKSPAEILVEVSGIGYRIKVPLTVYGLLPETGGSVTLSIHTHVREDALALYGFGSRDDRDLFERLIGVPGVGPRLGLALMSHLEPAEMAEAVRTRDTARLSRVPGVGPRTAERLAVELAGPMSRLPAAGPGMRSATGGASVRSDLLSALENLGYRTPQAAAVVERLLARPGASDEPLSELLRAALRAPGSGSAPPAPGEAPPVTPTAPSRGAGRRKPGGRP